MSNIENTERKFVKTEDGRILYTSNKEKDYELFANFVSVPDFRDGLAAETAYRMMWDEASKLCEAAGVSKETIQMVVKLIRAETAVRKECGLSKHDPTGYPEMTIAWKLMLKKEDAEKVPQEIYDELNHGNYVRG